MRFVKVSEDTVHELKKLNRGLVIELNHAQMAHKGRSVKAINDKLDLSGVEVGRL